MIEQLSERRREVLRLMAKVLTNEQIGSRLIIALGTVKAHIHNISGKLGTQDRAHAVATHRRAGSPLVVSSTPLRFRPAPCSVASAGPRFAAPVNSDR